MKLRDTVKWKVIFYASIYLFSMSIAFYVINADVDMDYGNPITIMNGMQFILGLLLLHVISRKSQNRDMFWGLFFGMVSFNIIAIVATFPF